MIHVWCFRTAIPSLHVLGEGDVRHKKMSENSTRMASENSCIFVETHSETHNAVRDKKYNRGAGLQQQAVQCAKPQLMQWKYGYATEHKCLLFTRFVKTASSLWWIFPFLSVRRTTSETTVSKNRPNFAEYWQDEIHCAATSKNCYNNKSNQARPTTTDTAQHHMGAQHNHDLPPQRPHTRSEIAIIMGAIVAIQNWWKKAYRQELLWHAGPHAHVRYIPTWPMCSMYV